jgi:hypothetical protein
MADEFKQPYVNTFAAAARARIGDAFHLFGKFLPATVVSAVGGNFYKIAFAIRDPVFQLPQLTLPLEGAEFIRYPLQAGAPGVVVALDTTISQITGVSPGTADLSRPANLESLVFLPIANKGFASITGDDGNTTILYGPTGTLILDSKAAKTSMHLTSSGVAVTMQGGATMTVTAGGTLSPVMTEAGPSPVLKADG